MRGHPGSPSSPGVEILNVIIVAEDGETGVWWIHACFFKLFQFFQLVVKSDQA